MRTRIIPPLLMLLGAAMMTVVVACSGSSSANGELTDTAVADDGGTSSAAVSPTTEASNTPAVEVTRSDTDPWVPAESRADKSSRINVLDDQIFIRNGGEVRLGEDTAIEVFVDPYPPSTLTSWLDIYLTREGEPVADASMGIEYDMLAMAHGPFWDEADNIGGGHYLFSLQYIMYGAWDQMITVRIGLERHRFPIVLVAYP
jgi:hypothetical protein